ncbi:hypothetical protein E2C01_040795 [Portunus trituberculatus]|uniref:Uncharacterized protein n=1 Tax=Portunus trituberculatus TaxID=210409 RepID=A0A5B7FIC2_PORTR|nr:hypothetical protein [Portunus trituberculatus]
MSSPNCVSETAHPPARLFVPCGEKCTTVSSVQQGAAGCAPKPVQLQCVREPQRNYLKRICSVLASQAVFPGRGQTPLNPHGSHYPSENLPSTPRPAQLSEGCPGHAASFTEVVMGWDL